MPIIDPRSDITGLILAGGQGRRMGGADKGLVELAGKSMVQRAFDRLHPQVASVLINANRNIPEYEKIGVPVVSDIIGDYAGPLAGMASGLRASTTNYVLTAPCDSPMLAPDLASRMAQALTGEDGDIAVAHDGERMHPVFALLRRDLLADLLEFLETGGRKIDIWFERHHTVVVDFSDRVESFANVNRPEDKQRLQVELSRS